MRSKRRDRGPGRQEEEDTGTVRMRLAVLAAGGRAPHPPESFKFLCDVTACGAGGRSSSSGVEVDYLLCPADPLQAAAMLTCYFGQLGFHSMEREKNGGRRLRIGKCRGVWGPLAP